ncbi:endolytic transglycosylase MltG [Anthocerotibacter panamensis]|uniref:endolytic transglycosylase MltG n=1 Tax=Anthocerotibacter panamensis TaxID=2857077 RepID=UPI001C406E78|nr:endolytic transglycosylase MltG [Anthocerotibacter panamensis]
MSKLQWTLLGGLLVLTLGLGLWSGWQQMLQPVGGVPVRVRIQPGMGATAIGQLLEQKKIIRSALGFQIYLWSHRLGNKLRAGLYDLDPQYPVPDLTRQLVEGRVVQARFTIPEGWNLQQIAHFFAQNNYFPEDKFWTLVKGKDRLQVPWLPQQLTQLEGFLFPDTYQMDLDQVSASFVVRQMLTRFEQVALPLYKANKTSLSLVEWVTLASIVEKEAVVPQERPLIAGVFLARLRLGIPLGSDPTVEYAFNLTQTPDRRLTTREVRQPSPYNTYVHPGLPPTPIAASGLASLQSVTAPATTDYLFFVARYDGTHIFSRTLQEHERAKRQIQTQRRQRVQSPLP